VVFTFADEGPGFAAEQAAVFGKPFNTHQDPDSWRGLGLYASTSLAARYGGTLANRRQGNVTLISATFPLLTEEQPIRPTGTSTRRLKPQSLPRQCFLVVEDDEAMRTLLLNRLQRRGHMVFCVDTCAEAVEEFLHLHDIITTVLMDVGLRDDSGYECCRRLLAISPQTRVVFMSGEHEPPRESCSNDFVFLQKPFTMDQLEQAIVDVHL
jgi:CheY-like chemotaxis protein